MTNKVVATIAPKEAITFWEKLLISVKRNASALPIQNAESFAERVVHFIRSSWVAVNEKKGRKRKKWH